MTKQLNNVTLRSVPAPAVIRPAGRNLKSDSASKKAFSHFSGRLSTDAKAPAIRCQLSSTFPSIGVPSSSLNLYFISQICSAMEASK